MHLKIIGKRGKKSISNITIKKKEIEKKYLEDIKHLDDEYETAIKNWIYAKNIFLKYLDERENQNNMDNIRINSVRSHVKEKDDKNINANISHPQTQRIDIANHSNNIKSKNDLEMKTPEKEEERNDTEKLDDGYAFGSPDETKNFDLNNNKNKKRKRDE